MVSVVAYVRTVMRRSPSRERRGGQDGGERNRYVRLTGAAKSVNRALETKNRALTGIKGYITNPTDPEAEQVIGAYSRLLRVEKSFRVSKSDLAARPIFHYMRVDRTPPDHRVRSPGRVPLDGEHHRLEHQAVRQDHPPLPHYPDPRRRPHHHRRSPRARRTADRPGRHLQHALNEPSRVTREFYAVSLHHSARMSAVALHHVRARAIFPCPLAAQRTLGQHGHGDVAADRCSGRSKDAPVPPYSTGSTSARPPDETRSRSWQSTCARP